MEVEGLDGIVKLTDKQLKNKVDSIKRKGRKNVGDFVLPCLKELRREAQLKSPTSMPTGSAAPEEGIEQLDDDFRFLVLASRRWLYRDVSACDRDAFG